MDGIVVMQSIVRNGEFGQVREGDQVFAGQPFMQIVDPSSMVLNATVNQVDAERLRLGMKPPSVWTPIRTIELPGNAGGHRGDVEDQHLPRQLRGRDSRSASRSKGSDPRLIPDLTGSAEIVHQPGTEYAAAPAFGGLRRSGRLLRVRAGSGRLDPQEGGTGSAQLHPGLPSAPEYRRGMSSRCSVPCSPPADGPGMRYPQGNYAIEGPKDPNSAWATRIRSASRSSPGRWVWRCAAAGCTRPTATPGPPKWKWPVARARRADFIISVRTRGDIKSARSIDSEGAAGARPADRPPGRKRPAGQEGRRGRGVRRRHSRNRTSSTRTTNVRAADGNIVQTKATQKMDDEADAMSKMTSRVRPGARPSWTPARPRCSRRSTARRTGFGGRVRRQPAGRSRPPSTLTRWATKPI